MPASAQRILTTHAGSLPRQDLLQMMFDRGAGKPVDETALEARIRSRSTRSCASSARSGSTSSAMAS